MTKYAKRFSHDKEDWETPDDLFIPLKEEFGIDIDVCATNNNKKCEIYYSPDDNALLQDWSTWNACWMNPPFGDSGVWVEKAYKESLKGATVVCLLPARTNTNWWHDYCMKGEIRFIRGRPIFKGRQHELPQTLAIVVFRSMSK